MGMNLYVKPQNDAVLERLFGAPAGTLKQIRALRNEKYDASSKLDYRTDEEGFERLDAWYHNAIKTIHPNAAALDSFDDNGLGRVNADHSQLATIGTAHGCIEVGGCGSTSTTDGMLAVLALQRSKYEDFTGYYIGFTEESLAQRALEHKRLCDKLMLAAADGRISEIYWA
jgi:hypothetical protein